MLERCDLIVFAVTPRLSAISAGARPSAKGSVGKMDKRRAVLGLGKDLAKTQT
jgi:hypothetical protein